MKRLLHCAALAALVVSGCTALTTQRLVDERGRAAPANSRTVSHCSGSEWTDNSMMAVVPIPIIGLGMPTQEINEVKADDVLAKCGPPDDARVTERSSRHPTRPSFQPTVTLTRPRLGAKAASPDVGASPGGGGATGGSTDVASSFATDASSILTSDAALPAIAAEDSCDGGISAR